jgi:hypothetical protein
MATYTQLEQYIRAPQPGLPESQIKYLQEELRKLEVALQGAYGVMRGIGPYLKTPFGSFCSTQDQTAANTTTAYAMTLNTTEVANGVSVANNSRITVDHPGVYNLQFSTQFINTDSAEQDVSVWFRKNGTDIVRSNSEFTVHNRHGSVDGRLIAALNLFVEMNTNDYVEIMWRATSTTVSIQHLAAQTTPTRPETPSVIATLSYVSELP